MERFVGDGIFLYELNLRCPFYFAFGMALFLYAPSSLSRNLWLFLIPVAAMAMFFILGLKMENVMIRTMISCVATLIFSLTLWNVIPSSKWPRWIVKNSFPVFVLHGMVLYLLPLPFKAIHCWQRIVDVVGPLPIVVMTVLISLVVAESMRRTMPRFSALIFGGR